MCTFRRQSSGSACPGSARRCFSRPPSPAAREAKGQRLLVDLLFWVTLLIVAGALVGDYLGIKGVIDQGWFWFGNQGLSYIQLGRFWQIGFFIGLALWSLLVMRALWPTLPSWRTAARQFWTGRIRLEHLIWASTINIALLYVFGMIPLTGIEKSFTLTDFWRWWVVHLWVEQSFEFFAAAISAYLLMAVGLVSRKLAERAVYFELILIFLGGVIGTGHHLYWAGGPSMWVPMGSMFSFIEVLPLVLLIIEAIRHHRLIRTHGEFKYGLAYLYIIGAAFWNFVGAGVFGGGTLNAPLVNYYEHGTFLTLNHAHTALFGAFGLLGIGLIYFCLRYVAAETHPFGEKTGRWAFWLYNGGLLLWIVLQLLPDRLAAARCGLRARTRLRAQPGVLRHDSVLAVDAAARRCGLRGWAVVDGMGFHREAAAPPPASPRAAGFVMHVRSGRAMSAEPAGLHAATSHRYFSPRVSGRSFSPPHCGPRSPWRCGSSCSPQEPRYQADSTR